MARANSPTQSVRQASRFVRRARTLLVVGATALRGFVRTRHFIQTRPILAELIAVGAGYAVGRVFRRR